MTTAIQNYFDGNYIYKAALSYAPTQQSLNAGKTFLWNHKEWILAGTVIGIVILKIVRYIKNRPQMPDVEMKTTLNLATLSIQIPKEKYLPPNVTLTFCIDTSQSMNTTERAGEVKKALGNLLKSAQGVVNKSAGAKISLAITGFNDTSSVVTPITELTSTNKKSEEIEKQVKNLKFDGSTSILNGLEGATKELKTMAKANRAATHVLILLTDAEDDTKDTQRLSSIQATIASTSAMFFAVGIGKDHQKDILKKIVTYRGLKGTYIDTTSGQDPIGSTVSKIYHQAIASFHELELTSPQLDAHAWSVINTPSAIENGQSKCKLGSLSEGKTLNKSITIHWDKLKDPLDLSTVSFTLTFTDPKGRKGQVSLPWNPTTTIDPAIVSAWKANL